MLNIIDSRIQYYVRKRHYKVFNIPNNKSPVNVSKTNPQTTTTSPTTSSNYNNKLQPVNSLYSRLEFFTFKQIILKIVFISCNQINYNTLIIDTRSWMSMEILHY